jgi:hypothetical protein
MFSIGRREWIQTVAVGAVSSALATESNGQTVNGSVPPLGQSIPLRFRQIHLDFHTSEQITGIGDQFDPQEFVATLKRAAVNSITSFARCHHGMIYYDTKAHPERKHPHLKRNLLAEQIEACHKANIRVPIYTTIQWDYFTAQRQPDWLVVDEKGVPIGTAINQPGFYRNLCFNSPYRQFLHRHIEDIFNAVPVDGLFLDIVQTRECSCRFCTSLMRKQNLHPGKSEDRQKFAEQTVTEFQRETSALIRKLGKDATIFYNAGHIGPKFRPVKDAFSHWELESLPSGGWGYMDFPLKARYTRGLDMETMGMTGKFHTSWGDFHSLKNPAALQFECFLMLAMNAKCSVGDQLHPSGKIDAATYELIGNVYREVEKKEPWCVGTKAICDVAVLSPEEFLGGRATQMPPAAWGVQRMLQELRVQFDIVDSASDLTNYKVVVMPDRIPVDGPLANKLRQFMRKGGGLIASFESGLYPDKSGFALGEFGLSYSGDMSLSPDFVWPEKAFETGLPQTELVMYLAGKNVEVTEGTTVLASTRVPYFNRTAEHFSSHRHTPSSSKVGGPAVTQSGRAIYFAHPIFEQYHSNAALWVKRMFASALNRLLPNPVLKVEGPSTLIATLNQQEAQNREIVHLLHYIPERRGQAFDVIEDIVPLHEVSVSVATNRAVKSVRVVPENKALTFKIEGGRCVFTLPKLEGHSMIEIS